MVKIGFYGAAGEVTGSCYIVTTDKARVMVDMGMHQGEHEADEHNRRMPPGDMSTLDAVVLTHAHLDHCGRLPLLVRAGFQGRIHCTPATAEITAIVLHDSARIQQDDAERFNRRLRKPDEPQVVALYVPEDVEPTLSLISLINYRQPREIAPGITVEYFDAGHILGSGSVRMTVHDGARTVNIVFSGDVGVAGSPILRDPVTPPAGDLTILESTYGDRDHKSLEATRAELLDILRKAQSAGAKVLIPAFAVGRTQDIVYHIGEFLREGSLKNIRVYVDSPMATETTDLYRRFTNLYDAESRDVLSNHGSPLNFPGLTYTRSVDESKRLNTSTGSMVIISASGMCSGGRIMHHLYHSLPNPNTCVVIVGYQGQGTLGRRLVDGAKSVRIFRDTVEVKASVHTLGGFSAHAGQSGLLAWAAPFKGSGTKVILTHGENGPRGVLKAKLKERFGFEAGMPEYGDEAEV
ncbi:MAG TPA: MBL fold metallo-hydrolase [Phycisphaerales bacterium]|nr:MBL fold metallo-hydrolase [Phycisphaerales bacterium]